MPAPDPRPPLRQAQDWIASLLDGVTPDQLSQPTPCDDWTVRDLIGHLIAGAGKIRAMGAGQDVRALPAIAEVGEGFAAAYRQEIDRLWQVWSDDALLSRDIAAPWGVVPGAAFLGGQTMESVAHGWDLAVATGQDSEAPADAVQLALGTARGAIPAEGRAMRPFAEVADAPKDAGPTEQLAAWLGRHRPPVA